MRGIRREDVKTELVKSTKQWVENHYTEKFCLENVSSSLYVNRSYLLRTFKDITGYTLLEYHNYVRCMEAKKLLSDSDFNITTICYKVGYVSVSHFSHVFKRVTGCSPTEYREQTKKERLLL